MGNCTFLPILGFLVIINMYRSRWDLCCFSQSFVYKRKNRGLSKECFGWEMQCGEHLVQMAHTKTVGMVEAWSITIGWIIGSIDHQTIMLLKQDPRTEILIHGKNTELLSMQSRSIRIFLFIIHKYHMKPFWRKSKIWMEFKNNVNFPRLNNIWTGKWFSEGEQELEFVKTISVLKRRYHLVTSSEF